MNPSKDPIIRFFNFKQTIQESKTYGSTELISFVFSFSYTVPVILLQDAFSLTLTMMIPILYL